MKIVVLGTRGFPGVQGGVENHCENLYPRMTRKNGCEIIVFARKPYVNRNSEYVYKGVKLIPLSCAKNKFLETFLHTFHGLLRAREIKPDILHIHAIGPSLLIPLARIMGFKTIMTNHGPDYLRKKWGRTAKIILKTGEYLGSKWTDKTIAISENIAADIKRKYKMNPVIIPNGVEIPEITQEDSLLKKYGLNKKKYILTVGRFVPEKGFIDLLDAFNHAKNNTEENPKIKEWKLVIAGDADHENAYSRRLKQEAARNRDVVLTGFLNKEPLHQLYSHAGLFALPSFYEGLPIVLLEAMSYGLSCIVSDIEANRQVSLSRGRFFPPGDADKIRKKIMEFIDTPLSKQEHTAQLQTLTREYDWEKIAEETLKVYYSVLNK